MSWIRLDPDSFNILHNPNPYPYLHTKNLEQNIYDLFLHIQQLLHYWKERNNNNYNNNNDNNYDNKSNFQKRASPWMR